MGFLTADSYVKGDTPSIWYENFVDILNKHKNNEELCLEYLKSFLAGYENEIKSFMWDVGFALDKMKGKSYDKNNLNKISKKSREDLDLGTKDYPKVKNSIEYIAESYYGKHYEKKDSILKNFFKYIKDEEKKDAVNIIKIFFEYRMNIVRFDIAEMFQRVDNLQTDLKEIVDEMRKTVADYDSWKERMRNRANGISSTKATS